MTTCPQTMTTIGAVQCLCYVGNVPIKREARELDVYPRQK
jgi:hypothetical protein